LTHQGQLDDLYARTLEPNVFYAPAFILAAMRHLREGRQTRLLLIWRTASDGKERRLVAALPLVREPRRYVWPLPALRAAEFYGTLSTPLLDPSSVEETWTALLDGLAKARCRALFLPFSHGDGPAFGALARACDHTGRALVQLGHHERALLRSASDGSTYLHATLETRRRKEADRQRRRLSEEGELTFHVAGERADVACALESFLELESAGWKGKMGTDLRSVSGAAAFIRDVATELAGMGAMRIATLQLSGRTVAAGIVAVSDGRAFYIKTAYDEALARFSPGLLLTLDLTKHLLDDPDVDDADSIAIADHPMIDRIWTARFPVVSAMIACRSGRDPIFGAIVRAERARERLRLATSEIRRRITTRRAG
jgi:CelD/BcsL family acetyltransferase involved in cellulose biosynthesis